MLCIGVVCCCVLMFLHVRSKHTAYSIVCGVYVLCVVVCVVNVLCCECAVLCVYDVCM